MALGADHKPPHLLGDEIWKFQKLLRKAESLQNFRKDRFSRIYFETRARFAETYFNEQLRSARISTVFSFVC